jgi:hypothetical protein
MARARPTAEQHRSTYSAKNMESTPHAFDSYAITIDIDWSPDFWIDRAAAMLRAHGLKSTWFVTHASPAVERLKADPLVECGVHPNFFQPSSHGSDDDTVLAHMRTLVPEATSIRAHALMQSSRHFVKYMQGGLYTTECSLYCPNAAPLFPHHIELSEQLPPLIRIPYFWEDDVECLIHRTGWDPHAPAFHPQGLKVYNFHPVYIGLNCVDFSEYQSLKATIAGKKSLDQCTEEDVAPYVRQHVAGAGTCFASLVQLLAQQPHRVFTQAELAQSYYRLHLQSE